MHAVASLDNPDAPPHHFQALQGSYYCARYYESSVGRFVSEDPLRFKADANFYSYVRNHPSNLNDPTALYGCRVSHQPTQ